MLLKAALLLFFPSLVFCTGQLPYYVLDTQGHKARVNQVLFTKDSRFLLTASDDKTIRVTDLSNGENIRTVYGYSEQGYNGMLYTIALSPDNKFLVSGGFLPDDSVRVYDFKTGHLTGLLKGNTDVIHSLEFSPDGRYLASSAHDGKILVWKIGNGLTINSEPLYRFDAHKMPVYHTAFSPDSKVLASVSYDMSIILWDVTTGKIVQSITNRYTNEVYSVVFTGDGSRLIYSLFDGTVRSLQYNIHSRQLDLMSEKVIHRVPAGDTRELAISKDGNYVLFGGTYSYQEGKQWVYPVYFYSLESGKVEKVLENHNNTIRSICSAPQNGYFASSGGNDNETYYYRLRDGLITTRYRLAGRGRAFFAAAMGNDNGKIYFGTKNDGRTWFAETAIDHVFSFADYTVQNGADNYYQRTYNNSGGISIDYIYHPFERTIRVGTKLVTLPQLYDTIRSYTLTPDGRKALVGSDFSLYRIDTSSGKIDGSFTGHDGPVWAVSVSMDGKWLLSGSDDQTLKIWNIGTLELAATLFISQDNEWIIWNPSGFYYASSRAARFLKKQLNKAPHEEPVVESMDSKENKAFYEKSEIIKRLADQVFPTWKRNDQSNRETIQKKPKNKREEIIPDEMKDF